MKRFKQSLKHGRKIYGICGATGLALVASASSSLAAIVVDYSALGTAVETEISSALTAWLPLAGVILGIGLAWTIGRRFLKG